MANPRPFQQPAKKVPQGGPFRYIRVLEQRSHALGVSQGVPHWLLQALLAGCRGSRGRCSPLDKSTAPPAGHAGMLRRSGDSQATPQQSLGPWEARLVDKRRFRLAERTAEFMLLLLNFCCCAAALLPRQPIGRPALGDTAALRLVGGRAGSGDG